VGEAREAAFLEGAATNLVSNPKGEDCQCVSVEDLQTLKLSAGEQPALSMSKGGATETGIEGSKDPPLRFCQCVSLKDLRILGLSQFPSQPESRRRCQ